MKRELGTLWIGGPLSWMEQLCLKSFVDRGQRITLFSYEDIPNVPDGVIRRDGREIIDTDDFIKYEKKNSYALFADLFRLHMIRRCPGMIWVDTDVYCQQPLDYDDAYVMGYELPDSLRVNNAVLGLPHDSPVLQAMLDFTADRYSIAPFLPRALRQRFAAARDSGQPVHVSQQPWGVWGPLMLTHVVAEFGLGDRVQPMDAFYPVAFPERTRFLRPARNAERAITPLTTGLHVWASNKREIGLRHDGLPPEGSWFDLALKRHGITPAAAPVAGRARHEFDAALLEQMGRPAVLADIGATAPALAAMAHARFGCRIDVVDLLDKGGFPDSPTERIAAYRDRVMALGVPDGALRIVARAADLRPADALVSLARFGDSAGIRHLDPVIAASMRPGSRLILDIRKGSGAFPHLKPFGTTAILSGTGDRSRVMLTRANDSADQWQGIARDLTGPQGWFTEAEDHSFLFVPRDRRVLVVTFDNLDLAMTRREDRRPWGFSFIEKQGWSMLGVVAGGWTWYRTPFVTDTFRRLRDEGFFARFDRVVFYGASMGGYAAAAFSAACPGADVVAISPQSTLDRALVPWETRYRKAWDRDFSGEFGDAAAASRAAGRVFLLHDPFEKLDSAHVARFDAPNVVRLRCPLMGHRLGSMLNQMGVLSPIILSALDGTLTASDFNARLRVRRRFPRYQAQLFDRAVACGHERLARRMAASVLAQGTNRKIAKALARLQSATSI